MTSPAFSRQRGPNRREVLEELAVRCESVNFAVAMLSIGSLAGTPWCHISHTTPVSPACCAVDVCCLQLSEARYGKRLKAALSSYMTPLLSSRLLSPAESSALWRGIADMKEVSSKLGSLLAAAAEEEDVSVGLHLAASEFKT